MNLYGLLSYRLQEVIEWYATLEDARRDLADILYDEPAWESELELVEVEIALSLN